MVTHLETGNKKTLTLPRSAHRSAGSQLNMPPRPRFSLPNQIQTSSSPTIFKRCEHRCDGGRQSTSERVWLCLQEKATTKTVHSSSTPVTCRKRDPRRSADPAAPGCPRGNHPCSWTVPSEGCVEARSTAHSRIQRPPALRDRVVGWGGQGGLVRASALALMLLPKNQKDISLLVDPGGRNAL